MKHLTAMTKMPASAMEKEDEWDATFILSTLQLALTTLSALQTKKAAG